MSSGRNRCEITQSPTDQLFVRTGSFLRHPNSILTVPFKCRMPFSRLAAGLYFIFYVQGQSFTLTTPFPEAHIDKICLNAGEKFFVKIDHVLAFSSSMFFRRKWRFDLAAILTSQLRYTYFEGPGELYVFGLGELKAELLADVVADFDQGSVIGWSNSLRIGVSTRSSSMSAFLSKEDICLDHFEGTGTILTQASTIKRLPKRFHENKADTTWLDYINALLGLRI